MKNKIILFLLLTMLFAKETYKQVRIYYQSPEDLHLLLNLGLILIILMVNKMNGLNLSFLKVKS